MTTPTHPGWHLNNYSFGGVTLAVWTHMTDLGMEYEVCDEDGDRRASGMGEPGLAELEDTAREIIEEQIKAGLR